MMSLPQHQQVPLSGLSQPLQQMFQKGF